LLCPFPINPLLNNSIDWFKFKTYTLLYYKLDINTYIMYNCTNMKHTISVKEIDLLKELRNWFMNKGYSPSIRELCDIMRYKSPRSISILLKRLMQKGLIERENRELRIVEKSGNNEL